MKLLTIIFVLPFLYSFKFNPMSQSLELEDGKKSSQFVVENDTAENMAIELTVKERKMNMNGKEELPATSDLSIFPPQMIIPPKEKRTVRVLWNGPSKLEVERSYRVIAEQLPLDVDKKKKSTGIQIRMNYQAAYYVTPEDAKSEIKVSLVEVKDGAVVFKVQNTGTKHQIIIKPKLTFKKGPNKWAFEEKDLSGFVGENVLAKSERIFTVNSKSRIPADAEVSLKLEK